MGCEKNVIWDVLVLFAAVVICELIFGKIGNPERFECPVAPVYMIVLLPSL